MWVTSRVRSLSRFSEKSRLLAVFLLILWKGLSWDTFFSKSLWTNRYFFQFHVPGARPQDSHHTLLLVIDTRSRPTRNSWGLKLKKKIVIPCFRGHPGILVPGLWGEKRIFCRKNQAMELNRKSQSQTSFCFLHLIFMKWWYRILYNIYIHSCNFYIL